MTTTFCDDFHRADGPLGNGWIGTSGIGGSFNIPIESNLAGKSDGSSRGNAWQEFCGGVTYQQASITVVLGASTGDWRIWIAADSAANTPSTYIRVNIRWASGTGNTTYVIRDSDGNTVSTTVFGPGVFATGDIVTLKCDSSGNVTVDRNGSTVLTMSSTVSIHNTFVGFSLAEPQISNFCTEVNRCFGTGGHKVQQATLVGAT